MQAHSGRFRPAVIRLLIAIGRRNDHRTLDAPMRGDIAQPSRQRCHDRRAGIAVGCGYSGTRNALSGMVPWRSRHVAVGQCPN